MKNVREYSLRSTWQRQGTAPLMYIRSTHFAWSESWHCGKGYRVLAHILHYRYVLRAVHGQPKAKTAIYLWQLLLQQAKF